MRTVLTCSLQSRWSFRRCKGSQTRKHARTAEDDDNDGDVDTDNYADDYDDDDDTDDDDDDDISPGCKCNRAEGWIHSNLQCLRMTEGWEYRLSPDCHFRDFEDFRSRLL